MEPLVVAGALAGGLGLAGLAVFAAWRYSRPSHAKEPETVKLDIVSEDHVTFIPPAASAQRPSSSPAPSAARSPSPAPSSAPSSARSPSSAPSPAPPPASPRSHTERAPAMVLTQGVAMQDEAFSRRAPARPPASSAPPPRRAPPMKTWAQEVRETIQPEVPTEWARRQVGPAEPGRVAGACGGCGARLSVSNARPLRIACPVCGRTKLIA